MKFNTKIIGLFFVLFIMTMLSACQVSMTQGTGNYAKLSPNSSVFRQSDDFDFVQMHNDIVDRLNEEGTDIFYITGNTLDIDGDNEAKEIHLSFEVFKGTSEKETDLAVSWFVKLIADAASEQNFKYEPATTESFGTVWNDYTLVANITRQDDPVGEVFYAKTFKAGSGIPFEPRAITWGNDYIEVDE